MKAIEAASKARDAREIALKTEKARVLSEIKSCVGIGATYLEYTVSNPNIIHHLKNYLESELGYDVNCFGNTCLAISWS